MTVIKQEIGYIYCCQVGRPSQSTSRLVIILRRAGELTKRKDKNNMKNNIIKIIEDIRGINYFHNINKLIENKTTKYNIREVKSFEEFKGCIDSVEWENITLEATNNLNDFLSDKRVKQYDHYNEIVEEFKSRLDFIDALSQDFENKFLFNIRSSLEWDILHYCLERVYLNNNNHVPLFFNELMNIYKNGNIPCGFLSEKEFDFSPEGIILYY